MADEELVSREISGFSQFSRSAEPVDETVDNQRCI
jgi:hypothetical protein